MSLNDSVMNAQEIREQLKPGDVVLVNGHFAVIEKINEHGVSFIMGSKGDLPKPITIARLDESKGERDVQQDDSSQGHQPSDKDALGQ